MFFRRIRLTSDGTFWEQYEYAVELDFEGLNQNLFDDLWVGMKDLPVLGTVRVGQMKIPQGLESYGSSKNLIFMERSALFDAFWQEFGVGIMSSNTFLNERGTWAAMFHRVEIFSPGSGADFGDGDYAATGRVSLLPVWEGDGRCFLHVGASYQWRHADQGRTTGAPTGGVVINPFADQMHVVRFRARPELRDAAGPQGFTTRFVDTGNILADNVHTFGAELMAVNGPLTIMSEATLAEVENARTPATVAAVDRGNPVFWGFYGTVAYCLTGESRGYDRRFGRAGTIRPFEPFFLTKGEDDCLHSGWGAWEIAYRFSYVDLNDNGIFGGELTSHTVGINWWLTQNVRLQANYINTYRDVTGTTRDGTVHGLGMRAILEF
jgi:phosphate-selective porin OprO/OprP